LLFPNFFFFSFLFFLPGVGSFTIIDDSKVTERDLGNNFFVDAASLGLSRAETVTKMLLEMNPFVEGHVVQENAHSIINDRLDFFGSFTMVLADGVKEAELRKLADFLWARHIPLVITRSYGFIGYLRLVLPEHGIIESHPAEVPDLRLQDPWKELQEFMDSVDLDIKAEKEAEKVSLHSHIPWLVLLFRFYQQYKKENGGAECPQKLFGKYLLEQRVTNTITGGKHIEENFDEGTKNAWRAYSKYKIPAEVSELLADPSCQVTDKSSTFWLLLAALKRFVANEGQGKFLPLAGGIPDMHSSTKNFMALQRIYNDKSEKDVDSVMRHLDAIASEVGLKLQLGREDVKRFCKNAASVRLLRYSSYTAVPNKDSLNELVNDEDQPEGRNVMWYLLVRAVGAFEGKHGRLPGNTDASVAADVPLLIQELDVVVRELGIELSDEVRSQKDDFVQEMVRYGGCELHNIAAFQGGVVSLEIIKLITHQWVPLKSTFVFNGINGTACSFDI
jgi:amyloid beta precursor protein binding protein 1